MADFEYEPINDNYTPLDRRNKRLPKDDKPITFLGLSKKIILTSELQILLSSGIPVIEALSSLETSAPDTKTKTICKNLKVAVESGYSFSEAIEKLYKEVFGNIYTSLVKAGEKTGRLDDTMERILVLLRKQDSIKSKIISASVYPCALIIIMFGLLILFSSFVLPRVLMGIVANGGEIPVLTGTLMDFSTFISHFWWLIIIAIASCVLFVIKLFRIPSIKNAWDNFIISVPFVNNFVRYANLSNFMGALSATYATGLPVLQGVELALSSISNNTLKTQMYKSLIFLKQGKSISEALYRTGAIPNVIISIISSGEKAGSLSKMLNNVEVALDKKVDMALSALTRLYEPITLVVLGLIVLFIAVSLFQGTSALGI